MVEPRIQAGARARPASDGLRVFATPGLLLPDELHLKLDRRGRLGAYWNGQTWIG